MVAHEQADQAYEVLSGINEIQYKKFMSFLIDGKIKEAEDLLNQLTYTYANHEMS